MRFGVVFVSFLFIASTAQAADGIRVSRGADATVFGNCVPSLTVENGSGETVDYLQVELVLTLADGQQRTLDLQSAYREGVLYPIEPGAKATLKQHLDTSRALGVACDQVKGRRIGRVVCEGAGSKACTAPVSVDP